MLIKVHSSMKPLVQIVRAGRIGYNQGLKLQDHLSNQNSNKITEFRNYLILQEFNPVYTIGIRTKGYTDEDEIRLRKLGAEFFRTNRGGLITFHGPGQLVAYPIIHLQQFKPSIRWYVSALEKAIIEACHAMNVLEAKTTEDTGIWVGNNKICAIGVHGSRYITTHGIGFNACTDLSWFEHIIPCGIEGKGVTSLSNELKRHVSVEETSEAFIKSFGNVFECTTEEKSKNESCKLLKEVKI